MKRRSFIKGTSAASLATATSLFTGINAQSLSSLDSSGPYHYVKSLKKSRQMPGFLLNFIATKKETNGAFALIEGRARKGGEPSLHVHEHEDEAFYMLEGEMMVTIGEEEFHVKPGDFIFLPRQIPHTQKFLTETVHVLLFISPAGLEEYFWNLSAAAENFEIPALSTTPPTEEQMKIMMEMNAKYGISISR